MLFTLIFFWPNLLLADPGGSYQVIAGHKHFIVEVADTAAQRQQGLMNRQHLQPDQGLLMVMPQPARVSVWMKQMQFPIDAVWLSEQGEVLQVLRLPICVVENCPVYTLPRPAKHLLEVGAGEFPLKVGERVEIIVTSGDSLPSQAAAD